MSNFEWKREPDFMWPPEVSEPLVIPGRERITPTGRDRANYEEFAQRRNAMIRDLQRMGRGSGDGNGNVPFGLNEETPSADSCAYYLSFRFGNGWGIHIGIECWFQIAKFLWLNGVEAAESVDAALIKLYRHEYFHFEIDKAVLLLERIVGQSTGRYVNHWITYISSNNPSWLEEALANAYALKAASGRPIDKRVKYLLGTWMKHQPPGYRDFDQFGTAKKQQIGSYQLLSDYLGFPRGARSFVHGFGDVIKFSPKSSADTETWLATMFEQKFEINPGKTLPLNVYFF